MASPTFDNVNSTGYVRRIGTHEPDNEVQGKRIFGIEVIFKIVKPILFLKSHSPGNLRHRIGTVLPSSGEGSINRSDLWDAIGSVKQNLPKAASEISEGVEDG